MLIAVRLLLNGTQRRTLFVKCNSSGSNCTTNLTVMGFNGELSAVSNLCYNAAVPFSVLVLERPVLISLIDKYMKFRKIS